MDLLEKPVYNYIKNNHGVITFRDMEELNFSYLSSARYLYR